LSGTVTVADSAGGVAAVGGAAWAAVGPVVEVVISPLLWFVVSGRGGPDALIIRRLSCGPMKRERLKIGRRDEDCSVCLTRGQRVLLGGGATWRWRQEAGGRSFFGSLLTPASYDASTASSNSSSGIAPSVRSVFHPNLPM